jgi:hypothetical protein
MSKRASQFRRRTVQIDILTIQNQRTLVQCAVQIERESFDVHMDLCVQTEAKIKRKVKIVDQMNRLQIA